MSRRCGWGDCENPAADRRVACVPHAMRVDSRIRDGHAVDGSLLEMRDEAHPEPGLVKTCFCCGAPAPSMMVNRRTCQFHCAACGAAGDWGGVTAQSVGVLAEHLRGVVRPRLVVLVAGHWLGATTIVWSEDRSPYLATGFAWGYGGTGPHGLADALRLCGISPAVGAIATVAGFDTDSSYAYERDGDGGWGVRPATDAEQGRST